MLVLDVFACSWKVDKRVRSWVPRSNGHDRFPADVMGFGMKEGVCFRSDLRSCAIRTYLGADYQRCGIAVAMRYKDDVHEQRRDEETAETAMMTRARLTAASR